MGVPLAVILFRGAGSIKFERICKTWFWLLLACILPFLYSLAIFNIQDFTLAPTFVLVLIGALFEEMGWRGFLFKALEKSGWLKMNLIIGMMWATWHLPAILTSNYPIASPMALGLLFFFLNVILLSFLFGWFRQKTDGLFAPILLHASHNFFTTGTFESEWKLSATLLLMLLVLQIWRKPANI